MNRIGPNILSQPSVDWGKLIARSYALPPQMVVIMDDPARAVDYKRQFPHTLVIHRTHRSYDPALHNAISAEQFVNENLQFRGTGVLVQVYNEPNTYDAAEFHKVIRFCCEVFDIGLKYKDPKGNYLLRFAFVNQAVGHVAEANVGICDPLLTRLAGYAHGSIWGLHEYAIVSTSNERPHRIGRFELLANRCRQLGLSPVQFGVTEYGRDLGGGRGDGYKQHMTSSQYVKFLTDGMSAYVPFNIPTAVFCYGTGYGWESFNIEDDVVVLNGIEAYGRTNPAQALLRGRPIAPELGPGRITRAPSVLLNVREVPLLPAGKILGQVNVNAAVRFRPYGDWYYIHTADGLRGYISRQPTPNGNLVVVA